MIFELGTSYKLAPAGDDWLDDLEYHLNHSYNIQNLEILEW